MKLEWEFIPRTFITSAVKFHGRKELLGFIEELNADFAIPEVPPKV
jgi:GTP-binding protein